MGYYTYTKHCYLFVVAVGGLKTVCWHTHCVLCPGGLHVGTAHSSALCPHFRLARIQKPQRKGLPI